MSIKAPKGTKDMLPQDSYKWQYIEKDRIPMEKKAFQEYRF